MQQKQSKIKLKGQILFELYPQEKGRKKKKVQLTHKIIALKQHNNSDSKKQHIVFILEIIFKKEFQFPIRENLAEI